MSNNALINKLNNLLADHAVFYQKLRNYHWNVKGPAFFQLHERFEQMYLREQDHVDALAERVLALGGRPKSTMREFLDSARLREDIETPPAQKMVENLRDDLGNLVKFSQEVKSIAEEGGDDTTVNLLDGIEDIQEEDAWMLRAWLG